MNSAEAAAELNQAATQLTDIPRVIVDTGSAAARQAILDTVTSRRGSLSVSGLGATLDVDTTVSSTTGSAQASIKAVPARAWGLVDKGAKPHQERVRRARGMPTPYGVFASVRHPGTAGLNIAATARFAADTAVDAAAQTALDALPRH